MAVHVKYEFAGREVSFDELRTLVAKKVVLATLESLSETLQTELGSVICPVHGEPPRVTITVSPSGDFQILTKSCCEMFAQTTGSLERSINQTAYFRPGMKLSIYVKGVAEPFFFDLDDITTLVIGRSDAAADEQLDVDLCKFRAAEMGVSRRHAAIIWQGGALHIVDRDSSNGTFLNEQPLMPHEPHVLRNGDTLRLGALKLQILIIDG